MPGPQDQQSVQQLLAAMNTMQMQAGLMPGGIPAFTNQPAFTPPPVMHPGHFSNNLRMDFGSRFAPMASPPPMFGGVSPVMRTPWANDVLPSHGGWGAARQQAQGGANTGLTIATTGASLGGGAIGSLAGAKLGAMGGAALGQMLLPIPFVGAALGGAIGGLGGGIAGGMAGSSLAELPFKTFMDQRQRALQIQNMSMMHVRTGGDLSASGMGLSNTASMNFERNLMGMTENRNFKRDTGGMFNRQDMMKITQISSQVGLLDNAQTVSQMTREMSKIGRALSTFMKIVEEPDVQEALKMMGKMRAMGMSIPETNVAASNARQFARMAGTTVQGVMAQGMQGAGMFQAYGMSAGAGFSAGMAATGVAGLAATTMDPRQLSMLGGREGMAQHLTGAAAKVANIDAFLPGLATMGPDGKLGINRQTLMDFAKGKRSATGLVQESARQLSGMGTAGFAEAYATQKAELQDQFMRALGPQGAVLSPMMVARSLMETGAVKTLGAGLSIALGGDEKQARAVELAAKSGNLFRDMRNAARPDSALYQAGRAGKRSDQRDRAGSEAWSQTIPSAGFGRWLDRTSQGAETFFQNKFGGNVDIEEQQAAQGGGDIIRAVRATRFGSAEQLDQLRGKLGTAEGREGVVGNLAAAHSNIEARVRAEARAGAARERDTASRTIIGAGLKTLFSGQTGPEGMGFGPKSEYLEDTVNRNEGYVTRYQRAIGNGPQGRTAAQTERRATDIEDLGGLIERGRGSRGNAEATQGVFTRLGATGMDAKGISAALATASGAIDKYATSKVGAFGGQAKDVSMAGFRDAIKKSLSESGASQFQVEAMMNDPQFMERAIALGEGGRSEQVKNVLSQVEKSGADIRAAREGRFTVHTRAEADAAGAKALGALGIFGNRANEADSKKLLEVFGAEGGDAEVRKQLMIAKSLDESANYDAKNGDPESAERKRAQAVKIRAGLENAAGKDPKKRDVLAKATAYVEGLATTMSESALQHVGEAFLGKEVSGRIAKGKASAEGHAKAILKAVGEQKGIQDVATMDEALVTKIGLQNTQKFLAAEQKQRGSGMAVLQGIAAGSGGKLGNLTKSQLEKLASGKMTESDLLGQAAGDLTGGAKAVTEGGNTSTAPATGLSEASDAMITNMEDWTNKTFNRADKSFKLLDDAATKLLEYTGNTPSHPDAPPEEDPGQAQDEASPYLDAIRGYLTPAPRGG